MSVERDSNFIVKQEDKWMLNDLKANASISNLNNKTPAQNL